MIPGGCKNERQCCRSPVACSGFGYCRERKFDSRPVNRETIELRRREAAGVVASVGHWQTIGNVARKIVS